MWEILATIATNLVIRIWDLRTRGLFLLLLFGLLILLAIHPVRGHSQPPALPTPPIQIHPDNPKMDRQKYGGNMAKNGELNVIRTLIKPGNIVFDVGANIGAWSTHVLRACPQVTIYAFEPLPQAADRFKRRMKDKPTKLFSVALSVQQGTRSFVAYKKKRAQNSLDGSTKSGFFHRPIVERGGNPHSFSIITVDTLSLDQFCTTHKVDHIDFLKIDTEGAEHLVLKGARTLLKEKRIKYIQFEYGGCYPDAKEKLEDVYKLLTSHGYSVFRIMPRGLMHIKAWRPQLENYQYSNYFAISSPA